MNARKALGISKVWLWLLILVLLLVQLGFVSGPQLAHSAPGNTPIIVDNNGDSPDEDVNDGVCDIDTSIPGSHCTMRAAIQQANFNAGADTINFSSSVIIISPSSALPPLTDDAGTTIYSDHTLYISGNWLTIGLELDADNNKVMGIIFIKFFAAIQVNGDNNLIGTDGDGVDDALERNVIRSNTVGVRVFGDNNTVAGNYIGIMESGSGSSANTDGVIVTGNLNLIGTDGDGIADAAERNIISASEGIGLGIFGNQNVVAGNYIGTNPDGDAAYPNSTHGVQIENNAQGNLIGTDGDGVADFSERNLISGNEDHGVYITGAATQNRVAGNYIGTNAAGTAALPNGLSGIKLTGGAHHNLIGTDGDGSGDAAERNLISGNTKYGVTITLEDTESNVIAGNYIGTNAAGNAAIPNQFSGVYLAGNIQDNVVGTDGNGSGDASEGNLIAGNTYYGVLIGNGAHHNTVAGNYVGINAAGTVALPNGYSGVLINFGAHNNLIGSDGDGLADQDERNVISGNTQNGVEIEGEGSDQNEVFDNYIGLNAAGTGAIPNATGVKISGGASSNAIGNWRLTSRSNVISGNTGDGVYLTSSGLGPTLVSENYIGTDASGTASLPNGGHGVRVDDGVNGADISKNRIAHNAGDGIFLDTTAGKNNDLRINEIYANTGLGIDLGPDGVNPNDAGDVDTGPNELINYPLLTKATTDGIISSIEGAYNGPPNRHIDVFFYASSTCDPSGYGEGQILLEGNRILTDAAGDAAFAYSILNFSLPGYYIVATASDIFLSTSEFSECILLEVEPGIEIDLAGILISDTSVVEGDSGTVDLDFTVSLTQTSSLTVTVEYATADGSAAAGADYLTTFGKVTFPPGLTTQQVTVPVLGDTADEADETLLVNLSNPINALLSDAQATGTIQDDDEVPTPADHKIYLPAVMK